MDERADLVNELLEMISSDEEEDPFIDDNYGLKDDDDPNYLPANEAMADCEFYFIY